jgi:hypothetical protein
MYPTMTWNSTDAVLILILCVAGLRTISVVDAVMPTVRMCTTVPGRSARCAWTARVSGRRAASRRTWDEYSGDWDLSAAGQPMRTADPQMKLGDGRLVLRRQIAMA